MVSLGITLAVFIVIWGTIAGLCHMFHRFGMLNEDGIIGMVFLGFMLTLIMLMVVFGAQP